jgi:rhodanese-related sulfurtransferase
VNIHQTSVHTFDNDAVVLDVREPAEWNAGHAPNAIHIPLGLLPSSMDALPSTEGGALPVICRSGVRSAKAVAYLAARGVDAVNVAGGMQAWEEAGKAMASENGQHPVVI